ncbi:MAG TPA: hypothetical protein VL484_09320 [Vicinamibacterales bacterium]|nr:hypothetical protein [Vicinamibacterales bacterium]
MRYAANGAYAGSGHRTGSSTSFSHPLGQPQFTQTGSPQGEQRLSVSFQHTTHSAPSSFLGIV